MSDHDLPELDPELRALLATESELLEPPDGAFERVFQRVGQSVLDPSSGGDPSQGGGPADAGSTLTASTATNASAATTGAAGAAGATLSVPVIAALAFLGGVGAGVLGMYATAPPPEVRVETRTVEVPVRVVETVYVPATPPDAAPPSDSETASTGAGDPAPGAARVDRPATPTDADAAVAAAPSSGRDRDLADENALVTRAQAALARGRVSEALAATSEHQRRFPRGEFVEEREALAIQALARAGRMDAAVARAERFRARYPRSMLRRAVDAAVGERPAP